MINTPASQATPSEGCDDWLTEVKARIHSAQQRPMLAVNRELVLFFWQIGHDILTRQARQGWGAKVIERLAQDLRTAFPDMKAQLKHLQDDLTISLLLCNGENKIEAENVLCNNARFIGVAENQLVESLPTELQTSLPSIEQIELELASDDASMEDNSQ
ncbi:hypothetical protein PFUM301597_41970 [Pseudomonas fluorescens]